MTQLSESIFSKIGGIDALHNVVDAFYDRVLSDKSVNSFFEGANMDVQRGKMKAFLMMALGGPIKFTGKDMRQAHTHLVENGLSDKHYDVIIRLLDESLREFNVSEESRKKIAEVAESVRNQVLNK